MKNSFFLSILALLLCGCGGHSSEKGGKDTHAEHEENVILTSYNELIETYVQATPLVAGKEAEIIAHFTRLSDFKPLDSAVVTATLTVNGKRVKQTLTHAFHRGIYKFHLVPPSVGKAELRLDIQTQQGLQKQDSSFSGSISSSMAVRVYDKEEEAIHAAIAAETSISNALAFSKEQSWKVDFATETVQKEAFGMVIKTVAQVLPAQGSEREIIAKAAGIVSFPNEYVVDGRGVQQDQSLFSIECGGLMENNIHTRYTEILNEYHRSKAEYERKKELAKDKIVSESVLLSAKMEFENAEENYKHLRKNFASGKQIVTAPISGFIKQILVRNGEYVQIGQRMLVISQNRSLFIKAEVSPKYYPYLGHIIGANVRELNGSKTYSLNDLHGKLISYGKSTDFESPLIPIVFEIDNKLEVIPGSFVDLYIKTEGDGWALTVPKGALIEEMGNFFVLVQINPELFEKRAVIKGVGDGFRVEIKQGLEPGERIVSKGAILIKLAQVSGGLDAHSGHVH